MAEARPVNSKPKAGRNQPASEIKADRFIYYDAQTPVDSSRLMTLREVCDEFDVDHRVVYAAAKAGHLHSLQRDGKGRKYYAEWEVRAFLSFLYRTLGAAA